MSCNIPCCLYNLVGRGGNKCIWSVSGTSWGFWIYFPSLSELPFRTLCILLNFPQRLNVFAQRTLLHSNKKVGHGTWICVCRINPIFFNWPCPSGVSLRVETRWHKGPSHFWVFSVNCHWSWSHKYLEKQNPLASQHVPQCSYTSRGILFWRLHNRLPPYTPASLLWQYASPGSCLLISAPRTSQHSDKKKKTCFLTLGSLIKL